VERESRVVWIVLAVLVTFVVVGLVRFLILVLWWR
jgi:hypothetical protein